MGKQESDKIEAVSAVEGIVSLPCQYCGERGRCQNIVNPKTKVREFWVKPERIGRCRNKQLGGDVCDVGNYSSEKVAIKMWNKKQAG